MTESDEDDSRSVLANKDAAILLEEAFNSSILRKENFYDKDITKREKFRDKILKKFSKILFDFVFEREKKALYSNNFILRFVKVVKRTY